MGYIKQLKDKFSKTNLYPITKTKAVLDDNGTALDSMLSDINDRLNNVANEPEVRAAADAVLQTNINTVNNKLGTQVTYRLEGANLYINTK